MKENDKLLPYLKKVQKLQIKYFGEFTLWVDASQGGYFSVVVFFKCGNNSSIRFYSSLSVEDLDVQYKQLLNLAKDAKNELC